MAAPLFLRNRPKTPKGDSQMPKKLMPLLAVVLPVTLVGCKTTDSGGISACASAWHPITWSQKDTARTIEEVKANNARREAWCKGS